MKYLCYRVYSKSPEIKDPVGYCILGDGRTWVGPTLDQAKHLVLKDVVVADFLDDCGWILEGEEISLLNPDYQDLLAFNLKLKYPDLAG